MDPRGQNNGLARHATKVLQFKPGSDVALLNGMLHTIIEENLYDVQYVAAHLEGFEALKSSMKDFAPEKMQEICGIDAKTIRSVARLYATSTASLIFWGMGVSQHIHGTDNARCLIALALTTGHRPTRRFASSRPEQCAGCPDAGLTRWSSLTINPSGRRNTRLARSSGRLPAAGQGMTVVEIINAILRDEIKSMYILGENPAASDPDQNHAERRRPG